MCQELFPNRGIVVRVSAVITQAINERTQSLLTLSLSPQMFYTSKV